MARTSSASVESVAKSVAGWTASYEDIGGYGPAELDPNAIGLDTVPDEVRDQFEAAREAARAIVESKAMGNDVTFNVVLEGVASVGHADQTEAIKVTVTKGPNALSVDPQAVESQAVYAASRYTDEVGAPIGEPEPELP